MVGGGPPGRRVAGGLCLLRRGRTDGGHHVDHGTGTGLGRPRRVDAHAPGTALPSTPTPLPDGLSVVYRAPGDAVEAGRGPGIGNQTVAVTDRNGQPVVVWSTFTDAAGAAAVIQAARYDPATGAWTKPVDLYSGPLAHDGRGRSLAAATDPATGTIHVVWAHGGDEPGPARTVSLASSTDDGATWSRQRVAEEDGVATPVVAADDDLVHVSWWSEQDGVVRAVGTAAADPKADRRWERTVTPVPAGFVPLSAAPAVVTDATGAPVFAYAVTTPAGTVVRTLVWRPDRSAQPVAMADLAQADPPALALALDGDRPVLALTGSHVSPPAAVPVTPTSAPPGTAVLPAPATTTSTAATSTRRDTPGPWAWVVRTLPTGAAGTPVAVEAGPAGLRTDDTPLPPAVGLTVLDDGTAAVALVPVTSSTTCVVARQGPGGEPLGRAACSRGADETQPQIIPSGRAPSIVRLGGTRVAVPLGNSQPAPALPVGVVLWSASA